MFPLLLPGSATRTSWDIIPYNNLYFTEILIWLILFLRTFCKYLRSIPYVPCIAKILIWPILFLKTPFKYFQGFSYVPCFAKILIWPILFYGTELVSLRGRPYVPSFAKIINEASANLSRASLTSLASCSCFSSPSFSGIKHISSINRVRSPRGIVGRRNSGFN